MAGAGYRDWVAGEKPTAVMFDTYLQHQTIMRFASAAARNAALVGVVAEGMMAWLDDVNCLTVYSGAAWSTIGPVHSAWIAFSPSWTANGGSAPAIGNGTLDGAYQRIGRTVHARIRMIAGSTTSFGSGAAHWRFTLPFTAGVVPEQIVRNFCYYDLSATAYVGLVDPGIIDTSSTFIEFMSLTASTLAWATGDKVLINCTYECGADA